MGREVCWGALGRPGPWLSGPPSCSPPISFWRTCGHVRDHGTSSSRWKTCSIRNCGLMHTRTVRGALRRHTTNPSIFWKVLKRPVHWLLLSRPHATALRDLVLLIDLPWSLICRLPIPLLVATAGPFFLRRTKRGLRQRRRSERAYPVPPFKRGRCEDSRARRCLTNSAPSAASATMKGRASKNPEGAIQSYQP